MIGVGFTFNSFIFIVELILVFELTNCNGNSLFLNNKFEFVISLFSILFFSNSITNFKSYNPINN